MKIKLLAAVAVFSSSVLFAQEPIAVDFSKAIGSSVVIEANQTTGYQQSIALELNGTMTNIVKRLVAEGVVCSVIGHKWEFGCGMDGCLVLHSGPMRHCLVCGKSESQQIGGWK